MTNSLTLIARWIIAARYHPATALLFVASLFGWFIGSFIDLIGVEMTQDRDPGKDYTEVFGTPVTFSSSRDAFAGPSAINGRRLSVDQSDGLRDRRCVNIAGLRIS